MAAIGQIAATVRWPGHDVRDARRDLLIATRASVDLGRRVSGNRSDQPFPVGRGLHALDAATGTEIIQRFHVVVATVMTTWAHVARLAAVRAEAATHLLTEVTGGDQLFE